jgi:DnaK suppressor protein
MKTIDSAVQTRLRANLKQRASALRAENHEGLLRSGSEHHLAIARQARDMEDDAVADLLVDINLAEIDRDVVELKSVESALRRMTEARYGRCDDCDESIDLSRLEVNPAAERCVKCQEARERMRIATPSL